MDKKARIITATSISMLLAFTLYAEYEHEYHPTYNVYQDNSEAFGKYSKGDVYIGNIDYIDSIKDSVKENDVLIIIGYQIKKDKWEPNACIVSSYEITDREERNEILLLLQMYEYQHPSDWKRTVDSMRVEWTVHNTLYNLGIQRERTKDVDLNNSEEKIYSNQLLRRLIK